jgi:hypothetical protein
MTPCSLVGGPQHFGETYCLHLEATLKMEVVFSSEIFVPYTGIHGVITQKTTTELHSLFSWWLFFFCFLNDTSNHHTLNNSIMMHWRSHRQLLDWEQSGLSSLGMVACKSLQAGVMNTRVASRWWILPPPGFVSPIATRYLQQKLKSYKSYCVTYAVK